MEQLDDDPHNHADGEGKRMTAFDFRPRFVPLIESGKKISTIRKSKRGSVGRKMQLYVGQRTPECRLIKEVTCSGIWEFSINENRLVSCMHPDRGYLWRQEGFDSPAEFIQFFEDQYGLPFHGWLHEWERTGKADKTGEKTDV